MHEVRQGLTGGCSRVRQSAAVLGLALSVGASGTLMPRSTEALAATLPAENSAAALMTGTPEATASSPTLSQQAIYHTVEAGESLWQIARLHQIDVKTLKQANSMAPDHTLRVGQVLRVPVQSASPEAAAVESPVHLAVQMPDSADNHTVKLSVGGSIEELPLESVESAAPPSAAALALAGGDMTTASTDSDSLSSASSTQQTMAALVSPQESATKLRQDGAGPGTATAGAADQGVFLTPGLTPEGRVEGRASSDSDLEAYRVQPGDTLSHIASKRGVSKDMLAQANGLSDPDKIVVGDTLHLPEQETVSARSAGPSRQASQPQQVTVGSAASVSDSPGQRAQASARQTPDLQISASTSVVAEMAPEQATPSQSPTLVAQSTDAPMANLLAEVRSLQSSDGQGNMAAHPGEQATTQSLSDPSETESNRVVIEAEGVVSSPADRPLGVAERELLAAAPLGSDIYAPINRPSVGRQVSPDMPLLPGPEEYLPEAPNRFDGYTWPARGTLTSGYGWRWGRMHRGIDVAGPVGTPIVAAADGTVERAGWNSGGYGNLVDIRHPDGSMTRYAHNSRILVRAGQQVRQGQQIAEMGSTGRSTGPHLHFEIHLPGQGTVNPIAHLPSR